MSRSTNSKYLQTHHPLKRLWQHATSAYDRLTPTEQWQLHDYFRPSKDLTDAELLAHRAAISKERPTLPQQAGKALVKLQGAAAHVALRGVRMRKQPKAAKYARGKRGQIQVYGVVKPELDLKALARALLGIAQDMEKHKQPESRYVEDQSTGQRLILDDDSRVIRVDEEPGSEPTAPAA